MSRMYQGKLLPDETARVNRRRRSTDVSRDVDDRETTRLFKEPKGHGFVLVLCLILAATLWVASWLIPWSAR